MSYNMKRLYLFIIFGVLSITTFGQTWTGNSDTNWNNTSNWSSGSLPTSSTDVVINYPSRYPIIDGINAEAKSITIAYNGSLTIQNGGELTVQNNFSTNSPIYISDSKLTIEKGYFKAYQKSVDVYNSTISANDFECGFLNAVYTENFKPSEEYLISTENFKTETYADNSGTNARVHLVNARMNTDNWTSYDLEATGSKISISGDLNNNGDINLTDCIVDTDSWISDPINATSSSITSNGDLTIGNSDLDNYFDNTNVIVSGQIVTKEGGIIKNNCYFSATDLIFDNAGGNSLYIYESELEFSNHVDNFIGDLVLNNQSKLSCLSLTGANSGSNLEVRGESVLIIENKFTNYTTIYIDSGSSLIQTSETDLNVSNAWNDTDQFTIDRSIDIERDIDYVYWSSPVPGYSIDDIGDTTYRYEWEATKDNGGTYASNFGNWKKASGEMTQGKGYIVRGFVDELILDDGNSIYQQRFQAQKPYNGNITVPIYKGTYTGANYTGPSSQTLVTSNDDNWNLLGNPYPSAISAQKFLELNKYLDGNVRIWTHTNGLSASNDDPFYANETFSYNVNDYITYNLLGSSTGPSSFNGYIASGQGFFVLFEDVIPSTEEEAYFTNDMRTYDTYYTNTEFYRTDETSQKSRIWLELIADETKSSNTMLLGYTDGATEEKDRLYDAVAMDINTMGIYSLIDNQPMVIQGRSLPFLDTDQVPLSIITTTKDLYSIGIKYVDGNFENNQDIYLEDLYENTIHNLKDSAYTFSSEAGTFNDRFILRYQDKSLSIDDAIIDSEFKIIATQNFIKASTTSNTINSIIVYDILGRVLYQTKGLNTTEVKLDQLAPTQGPLIVKATLANGTTKTQKVIY